VLVRCKYISAYFCGFCLPLIILCAIRVIRVIRVLKYSVVEINIFV
jgi:hypothetical protein